MHNVRIIFFMMCDKVRYYSPIDLFAFVVIDLLFVDQIVVYFAL